VGDQFGAAVALEGNNLLVGASGDLNGTVATGTASVFVRSGTTWSLQGKLLPTGAGDGDSFGGAVALSGGTALVGAAFQDDSVRGPDVGAAYVFVRSGTVWSQQQKLLPADAMFADYTGWSVALAGQDAMVGAVGSDARGVDSGAVYVFQQSGTTWSRTQTVTALHTTSGDFLGSAVALTGTRLVAGASGRHDIAPDAGAVYIFEPAAPPGVPALGAAGRGLLLLLPVLALVVWMRRWRTRAAA
jgi:FG-GAP repeat